jgi:glycerol-3-phosphate dehydrogenase
MLNNNKSVEGYVTTHVVSNLVKEHNIHAPLLDEIYHVLYEKKDPKIFVSNFIQEW